MTDRELMEQDVLNLLEYDRRGYTDLGCGFVKRRATSGRVAAGFTTATSIETARFVGAL